MPEAQSATVADRRCDLRPVKVRGKVTGGGPDPFHGDPAQRARHRCPVKAAGLVPTEPGGGLFRAPDRAAQCGCQRGTQDACAGFGKQPPGVGRAEADGPLERVQQGRIVVVLHAEPADPRAGGVLAGAAQDAAGLFQEAENVRDVSVPCRT